jgi:hypothetical protein
MAFDILDVVFDIWVPKIVCIWGGYGCVYVRACVDVNLLSLYMSSYRCCQDNHTYHTLKVKALMYS